MKDVKKAKDFFQIGRIDVVGEMLSPFAFGRLSFFAKEK